MVRCVKTPGRISDSNNICKEVATGQFKAGLGFRINITMLQREHNYVNNNFSYHKDIMLHFQTRETKFSKALIK